MVEQDPGHVPGDELYPNDFCQKAEYKLANLMKHGYQIQSKEAGVVVNKDNDTLLILPNGDVFKKVIY